MDRIYSRDRKFTTFGNLKPTDIRKTGQSRCIQNQGLQRERIRQGDERESQKQVLKGSKESRESDESEGHLLISIEDTRRSKESRQSDESSGHLLISGEDPRCKTADRKEPNRQTEHAVTRKNHIVEKENNRLRGKNSSLENRNGRLKGKNHVLRCELTESRLRIHSLEQRLQRLDPGNPQTPKPPKFYIGDIKKILKHKYSKPILAIIIFFLLLGVCCLGVWLHLNQGKEDGNTKSSTRLGKKIEITYTVPIFVEKDYEKINFSTPNGETYTYTKMSRKKRSNELWQLLTTKTSTETSFTLLGPVSDCSAGGAYRISFIKDSEELHSQRISVQIESERETSGSIQRKGDIENIKEFTCNGNGGCEQSFITVHNNDGLKSDLRDMTIKCVSTYDVATGYQLTCNGKTNKSEIVCFLESEYLDGAMPKSRIVSECDNTPCLNDGTCTVPEGGKDFMCSCGIGFTGRRCQTNIDECASNPCRNDATCVDGKGDYTCTCMEGYTGTLCERDIDECVGVSCNNGACQDQVNEYKCNCFDGYTGGHCETAINECESTPCSNEAICSDEHDGYKCTCKPGYTGVNCEREIYACDSNPCLNEASCVDVIDEYTCNCVAGFTGTRCEEDINECLSSPCKNGGTCEDNWASFTCACVTGYTGTTCAEEINNCKNIDCNHGVCVSSLGGYECDCEEGYIGAHCQSVSIGRPCTKDEECVVNAVCKVGKCVCPSPHIASIDDKSCFFGCNESCLNTTGDFYSIYGDPCGSKFKRCVNGTLYVQQCRPEDVFNPEQDDCVCIPKTDAKWCVPGIREGRIKEVCARTCTRTCTNGTVTAP